MNRHPVLADKKILISLGADVEVGSTSNPVTILKFKNWIFSSFHTSIYNSSSVAKLASHIDHQLNGPTRQTHDSPMQEDHININGYIIHLPPIIFGHDVMTISTQGNSNGRLFELNLLADDAILCWAKQHTNENLERSPLDVIEVPYANSWKSNIPVDIPDIEKASIRAATQLSGPSDDATPAVNSSFLAAIADKLKSWDWTFSSDYCFSMKNQSQELRPESRVIGGKANPPTASGWTVETSSGIDTDMLRDTNEPIVFYDEITLYQDDLEDCGEVSMTVKLRVMPKCWFLLNRMFLRVDGSRYKIRETRLFHVFGTDRIHMELLWKELDLLSSDDSSISSAALRERIKGDHKLQRDGNALSQLLPVVNDIESMPRYFSLELN